MSLHPAPTRTPPIATRRPRWLATALATMLIALAVAVPAVTLAATQAMAPACNGVNIRTSASTSATVKTQISTSSSLTVVATVSGSSWGTYCPTWKSGSTWYRISEINGRSVSSLYGVSYLYAATGVLTAAAAGPVATPSPSGTDPFGTELMRLVNLDRVALGKPALVIDDGLAAVARDAAYTCPTNASLTLQGRSRDMANRGYFSHTVPGCFVAGTSTPYASLDIVRTVFGYSTAQSEIIAWNAYGSYASTYKLGCDINGANCTGGTTTTPYTVGLSQRDFMSSSVHRAAELGSSERFGCGAATVPGTIKTFFTCLFATAAPTATPSPSPTPAATPTPAPAATPSPSSSPAGTAMTGACNGVNIRTSASTSATVKTQISTSSSLTVVATVSGSSWGTYCPTWKSGSTWYRISEINGRSVSSLYGVSYLYAATGVLTAAAAGPVATPSPSPSPTATPSPSPTAAPTATPSPSPTPAATPTPAPAATPSPSSSPAGTAMTGACNGVNIRTSASTSATVKTQISTSSSLTVVATVSGSSWGTYCPTWKSGSTWYRISEINGRSVSSLYGVSYLYAATGVLTAAATAVGSTDGVPPLGTAVTFYGRGYGHGVGLSQYGARGRALAGQTAAEILAHYYQGTTLGTIPANTQIRVLLLDNFAATAAAPLAIVGRGGSWGIHGQDATYPADSRIRLFPPAAGSTAWRLVVDNGAGTVLADQPAPADLRLEPRASATTLQLLSKPSTYDLYRGVLHLVLGPASADVVNELPMEDYLRGVVPAEMPSSWPAEALAAQAIAARSYAAYRLGSSSTFDAYDDTRSQVYLGVRRETATTDAVVAATSGKVILSGGKVANALFHSTGGGATENNENVFVSSTGARVAGPVSYLRGSSDRDPSGVPYDAAAPYATWQTATYTPDVLSVIFASDPRTAVGTLLALDLHDRGVSGRLISVTLIGSAGTRTVSGQVFSDVFNAGRPAGDPPMRSTLVDVAPIP